MDKVILECIVKNCPRKLKTDFDEDTMPEGTVKIKSYCPWHLEEGGKEYSELYFDKNGKELFMREEERKERRR